MTNEPHDRVIVGQIWKERAVGNRLLRVDECRDGYAYCMEGCAKDYGFHAFEKLKRARIRVTRMKPPTFALWRDDAR